AAATDLFDGWLARKLNATSHLGAILDTWSDKAFALLLIVKLTISNNLPISLLLLITIQYLMLPIVGWIYWKRFSRFPVPNSLTKIAAFAAYMTVFVGVTFADKFITVLLGLLIVLLNFAHIATRLFAKST
ncbi:MAG TPA: hypothetical protein DCQ58_11990, partial [Saprospirales bacterium]|nr:hypothetical protein [Saprospirales bacterium]